MDVLKPDQELEPASRCLVLDDYAGAVPRWCPGCGDHAVLASLQRLARDEQLPPEKTVVVSGIGCSSRFPHYMKTYGFHGLHGRALPVASGIRSRRPDLHVFVITGDGDCCAIGTAHWIHAVRYNMKMTVMLLDNQIYGLTKMQTSPTSPKNQNTLTHPAGNPLPPLNPLTVTLGITNASFVAQSVDWSPPHLHATLAAAHAHDGLSFVRILQRCPHYVPEMWKGVQQDPNRMLLLEHDDGITMDPAAARIYENRQTHDPTNLEEARGIASREDVVPMGLLYYNPSADRYDLNALHGLDLPEEDKVNAVRSEIDEFLI